MNITEQPKSSQYGPNSNVPPNSVVLGGLDYLAQIDQVLIHQQVEVLEVATGIPCRNRYQIKNSLGQPIYFAAEEGNWEMYFCGSQRGFVIHLTDSLGQEVFRVVRRFKCCSGCCWCADMCDHCAFFVYVETVDGETIGSAKQTKSGLSSRMVIRNAEGEDVLRIRGPTCICQTVCCTNDVDFKIYTVKEGIEIGCIAKQWGGYAVEAFTKATNFSLTVPLDLDVRMKAVLLGSVFLLDFMHFETAKKKD